MLRAMFQVSVEEEKNVSLKKLARAKLRGCALFSLNLLLGLLS
jgi:hypothetical protein